MVRLHYLPPNSISDFMNYKTIGQVVTGVKIVNNKVVYEYSNLQQSEDGKNIRMVKAEQKDSGCFE